MTIGEKIKYFRAKKKITQDALAELCGIHPVSIRKYETNKMQPQPPQIERIATALGVSFTALNGVSNTYLRLETLGDLMGLLMVLYDSGIIQVKGQRNADGSVSSDVAEIRFNPILPNFFDLSATDTQKSLENIIIKIKDTEIMEDFLNWDKISYQYTKAVLSATEDDVPMLEELLTYKNEIELELMSSTKPLENI